MRDVQKQTSLPKRFYKSVTVGEDEQRFSVLLDGKIVKTPAKNKLLLPNKDLAEGVAQEWSSQKDLIDPAQMPLTRMANSAVDGVCQNQDAVFEEIARFCGTDMLFYRAQAPQALVQRQSDSWDPILDWARQRVGAHFVMTEGIMHVDQPQDAIDAFSETLRQYSSPFQLTGLHSATTLMGSALLALALAEGRVSLDEAWDAAHIDEDWNISQWGEDLEAKERRAFRWRDMQAAAVFIKSE